MAAARGRKKAINEEAGKLLSAMKFLGLVYKQDADAFHAHTFLSGGWAWTQDGVVVACTPIGGDVVATPETRLFVDALSSVGKAFEMTINPDGSLVVVSDNYTAYVEGCDFNTFPPFAPDPAAYPLDLEFVKAVTVAAKIVRDKAELLHEASVYLNGQTVMATNGALAIEVWHGNNMPFGLVFPHQFAKMLGKVDKTPVSFGFSETSFTIHYDDSSFIKTNLYQGAWTEKIVKAIPDLFLQETPVIVPKGFFEALKSIEPFTDDTDRVFLSTGMIATRQALEDTTGATVELPSLSLNHVGLGFNVNAMLIYSDLIQTIAFGKNTVQYLVNMFGGNARMVLAGSALPSKTNNFQGQAGTAEAFTASSWLKDVEREENAPAFRSGGMDDDIPF